MLDLLSTAAAVVALGFTLYLASAHWLRPGRHAQLAGCRRALLVCAHPDDECMFFGPAVIGLQRQGDVTVYLLCLSTGDFDGQGRVRREELYRSCSILGIKRQNVILLRHSRLPDNPHRMWNDALLASLIRQHACALDIDTVLSFDHRGVSHHRNHRSIFYGLVHCIRQHLLPDDCQVYFVPTVNRLRKYSSFLDVPLTLLACDIVFLASLDEWTRIQHAMGQHRSQRAWFRVLYMLFSRYVFVNTLERLQVAAPEPEPAPAVGDDDSSSSEFVSPPESPPPPLPEH